MKILVTGGAGFIGSALVPEFLAQGHEVDVYDNLSFGRRELVPLPDERFHEQDIRDSQALQDVMNRVRPDWVVHLAAIHFIPYCNEHPYEAAEVNIRGTMNVMDAAASLSELKGMLFASTAAVYAICDEACREDMEPDPSDIYGLSKLAGERISREFHLRTSVPTVMCRFFNAFGPNETNPHLIPEIEAQLKSGSRLLMLGNMEPKRDFIHTSDMARAVRMLTDEFKEGIGTFNLGSGSEHSITEIVKLFEQAIGESIEVEQDPKRTRKSDRLHLLSDISRLKQFIDWKPEVSLEAGLADLLGNA